MINQEKIDADETQFDIICDGCQEKLSGIWESFQNMMADIKRQGWGNIKVDWGWANYCPECFDKVKRDKL